MVKPKHYAMMTLLAATLITVLPTGVFVVMGRSPFLDEKQATVQPILNAPDHSARSTANRSSNDRSAAATGRSTVKSPGKPAAIAHAPVVDTSFPVPPVNQQPAVTPPVQSEPVQHKPAQVAAVATPKSASQPDRQSRDRSLYSPGYWGNEILDLTGRIASSDSRTTKPAAADPVPTPTVMDPPDVSQIPDFVPVNVADATGHMIDTPTTAGMMDTTSAASGSTASSAPHETRQHETTPVQPPATETTPSRSDRRRSRSRKPATPTAPPVSKHPTPPKTAADGSPIVEINMQTPVESRRVRRVENVVATTNESGWPIALIRSDLPDSRWWVQQITSIRGNAFAARVNFGNTESISGGKYRLIFVFLDTQDEVTRFRIAKQFKELPKGVRRTREYQFILR